jgi:uncharacterized membrane protein
LNPATNRRLLLLIIVVGAGLRLWQLGGPALWLDEVASIKFATLPWSTLWISGYDNAPPLYYSLVKLMLSFGDDAALVRLPGAVFGILAIPVVYLAAAMIAGPAAGLVAALVTALSTVQIDYSQEARAYSLVMLAQSFALLGLLRVVLPAAGEVVSTGTDRWRHDTGVWWYAAGILVALYSHNIAVIFVLVTQLYFFVHLLSDRQPDWQLLRTWLLANTLVLLLWLPWVYVVVTELLGNGSMDWLLQESVAAALQTFRDVNGSPMLWVGRSLYESILLALVLFACWQLRKRPRVLLLLLLIALGAPLFTWLIGFYHPLYMLRTVAWTFSATAILIGIGVAALRRELAAVALLVITLALGRAAWVLHDVGGIINPDWPAVDAVWRIDDALPVEQHAVIVCGAEIVLPFLYHARHREAMPHVLAWAPAGDVFGAALVSTAFDGGKDQRHWVDSIPRGVFRWQRQVDDQRNLPTPHAPDVQTWRRGDWQLIDVVIARCPADGQEALFAKLAAHGWRQVDSQRLKVAALLRFRREADAVVAP